MLNIYSSVTLLPTRHENCVLLLHTSVGLHLILFGVS